MQGQELHLPAGSAASGGDPVEITPEAAGWTFCGLRVIRLGAGEARVVETDGEELAVVPLGGGLTVDVEHHAFRLVGRESVFTRVSDWVYLPIDTEVRLRSEHGCEVALASARASRRFEPAYVDARAVQVEVRGAGQSTRQVTNFMTPDAFPGADRLICCEALTPDGNWSSYPPHKHDGTGGSPEIEEVYYFRIGRVGTSGYAPEGRGVHRTYSDDGSLDATVTVADGDVFLVPRGYHGPCISAPGYPLYYLNVMAGPAPERVWQIVDDPEYAWIRDTWESQEQDPRCPLTSA